MAYANSADVISTMTAGQSDSQLSVNFTAIANPNTHIETNLFAFETICAVRST